MLEIIGAERDVEGRIAGQPARFVVGAHLAGIFPRRPGHQLHHALCPGVADDPAVEARVLAGNAVRQRPGSPGRGGETVGGVGGAIEEAVARVARRPLGPHREVRPANRTRELGRQDSVGIIVELLRQGADEKRLLRAAAAAAELADGRDQSFVFERAALGGRDEQARRPLRRRHRPAEPLERELAVE